MEKLIFSLAFLSLFLYVWQILSYTIVWRKKAIKQVVNTFAEEGISVLIPFRNEAANLPYLIADLQSQTAQNFEVIFIDDHSEDKSYSICSELIKNHENFRLLSLSNQKTGKKKAIALGIEKASFSFIVSSDSDCRMDENWIKAYQNCINEKNPDFIIAPVLMQAKNYFERLQSLEFFSLIVSGGAAALKNKAIMCNGANLGFKKELFFENQNLQNQKFASGDDMMLLMAAKKSNKKIEFCFSTDICVQTKAQSSLKAFFAQRLRWASKGPFYSDFDVVYTALLVLSLNMFIAFFLVSGFFIFPYFIVGIVMLLFKSIVDFLFLKIAAKSFQQKKRIPDFLIIQLVYPFYIMVSASGMFFKPKWKGRIIV